MKINEIREPPYLRHENKQGYYAQLVFLWRKRRQFYSLIKGFDI